MKTMFQNLWTTLLGIGSGMVYYMVNSGNTIPQTKQDWSNLLVAAFLAATGLVAKDATTGSKPKENEWPNVN